MPQTCQVTRSSAFSHTNNHTLVTEDEQNDNLIQWYWHRRTGAKKANPASIRNLVVDEERIRPEKGFVSFGH